MARRGEGRATGAPEAAPGTPGPAAAIDKVGHRVGTVIDGGSGRP